jgi:hypothetical protein
MERTKEVIKQVKEEKKESESEMRRSIRGGEKLRHDESVAKQRTRDKRKQKLEEVKKNKKINLENTNKELGAIKFVGKGNLRALLDDAASIDIL